MLIVIITAVSSALIGFFVGITYRSRLTRDSIKIEIGKSAEKDEYIEIFKARNLQLELEVKDLKKIELKYKVAKMLIDDDPAIDELLACKKEEVESISINSSIEPCRNTRDRLEIYRGNALSQSDQLRGHPAGYQTSALGQASMMLGGNYL